jgi:hypothetical protein
MKYNIGEERRNGFEETKSNEYIIERSSFDI